MSTRLRASERDNYNHNDDDEDVDRGGHNSDHDEDDDSHPHSSQQQRGGGGGGGDNDSRSASRSARTDLSTPSSAAGQRTNTNNNNANSNNNINSSNPHTKRNTKASAQRDASKRAEITVERTVIHEALIRRAHHKELKTHYDSSVVPLESEIELETQKKLVLSYCNIYSIDNLLGFETYLTQLNLDNNIIERIENLSHLTNLTWLDLSFNKITKITGLDCLIQLTDLSLFDNEITVVEGLDSLKKLNVLSLGNNQIKDLSFIQGLRKFKNLRALNLKGNPICAYDDYHTTIYAYLINLKYLDYIIIEQSQFLRARDAKLDQLLILEAKEKQDEILEKELLVQEEQQKKLDTANLQGVATLFQDMIKADTEYPKIRVLPGFEIIQNQYKNNFSTIVEEFSNDILVRHQLKQTELQTLRDAVEKHHTFAEKESRAAIAAYEKKKKKGFKGYMEGVERGASGNNSGGNGDSSTNNNSAHPSTILSTLKSELDSTYNKLMEIELLLVQQIYSNHEQFTLDYKKLISDNLTKIGAVFRSLVDGSNKHTSAVYDLTHQLLERFTKDETAFTDDLDVRAILQDKDILNNAVSTSHENQEGKILAKEEEVTEREKGNGEKLIKELNAKELARNRKRVSEIHEWKAREEAAIAEEEEQQEEEEDA